MNRRTIIVIGVFLIAAVAWATVVLFTRHAEHPLSAGDPGGIRASSNAVAERTGGQIPAYQKFNWSEVESSDYRRYVANLKSIGCPRQTLVDIVTADVNSLFKVRATNIINGILKTNAYIYWRSSAFYTTNRQPAEIYAVQLRLLNAERLALLRTLLGDAALDESLSWAPTIATDSEMRQKFAYLPPEKREKVRLLVEEYVKKVQALVQAGNVAEFAKQVKVLNTEIRAKIAADLSAVEMEQFDRHSAPQADATRREFGVLDLTEDEFNKIVRARIDFEDRFDGVHAGSSKEDIAQKLAAQEVVDASIKSIVGDERYQEAAMLNDYKYLNILQFTENNGISKTSALELYSARKQAEQAANAVRLDPSVSATVKAERLSQIRSSTIEEIQRVLGVGSSGSYLGGANWINRLESPEVDERAKFDGTRGKIRVIKEK